jgi:N-acylglucosamine 2-epimerase
MTTTTPAPAGTGSEFISHCRRLYRSTLIDDIVPFWMRHGIDKQHGGIGNMLDDHGKVLGTDKYLWSQGRALWTFSALCNRIERRADWLAFADHIFEYLRTHGRDEQGKWMFRLDKDGNVLDRDLSIYVDGFVLAGMTEYFAATKNETALKLALETYHNIDRRLKTPGSYDIAPYHIPPGMKTHGVAMCFALFFFELGQVLSQKDIAENGLDHARQILNHFYQPQKDAVVEFVTTDGKFVDSPEGRACVPGHTIESMWFLISIFERAGDLPAVRKCCQIVKRNLELAWDEEYGGLILAIDIDGKDPPFWKFPTHKPWWVQAEALVATAYAHVHTGEAWCLEWHRKVQEFAFTHYPVPTGEWSQWVDRQGRRMGNAFLPVKDPFHLPRALIYLIELFETRIS